MANSTLIKSIDIHYKTPRPLWDALLEPSNMDVCLQIPSGSVWKTKQDFTSTSLTSYNKQNNVFLMDGESRPPPAPLSSGPVRLASGGFPMTAACGVTMMDGQSWWGLPLALPLWDVPWTDRHIVVLNPCWLTAPPAGTATESPRKCHLFHFHILAYFLSHRDRETEKYMQTHISTVQKNGYSWVMQYFTMIL